MVTVPGTSSEPRLVYICHMDTVTLGEGWNTDTPPLGAVVHDDRLYGRGSCDMKGGLANRYTYSCAAGRRSRPRIAARARFFAHLLGG